MLKRVLRLVLVSMLGFSVLASAQASWDEAGIVVSEATTQMKQLLVDKSLHEPSQFERLFAGVDRVLAPAVDFDRIARGVMAKHYRNASAEQRQRFSEVFRGTLVKTYSKALMVFVITDFKLVPNPSPSRKAGREIVRVDVLGTDGKHYLLDYFMVRGDQGWRLANVIIDGINLGQLFKRQFAETLDSSNGDIDRVIEQWRAISDSSSSEG